MRRILLAAFLLHLCYQSFAQQILKDLRAGQDGSEPIFNSAVLHNGSLYFIGIETGSYSALFKTNGTAAGTTKLIGTSNFSVYHIYGFIGNDLIFSGGNFTDGFALYKTDASGANYTLIKKISNINSLFIVTPHVIVGNTLYFFADDDTHGYELWKSDGTETGTQLVKDINPGSGNSLANTSLDGYFGVLGTTLFFAANDPTHGAELWKSDGTEAGTQLVKDIETDNSFGVGFGSNPTDFKILNGKIYFSANRTIDGRELWVSDGTAAGTQLVKDLAAGSSSPTDFVVWNGNLYFNAYANNEYYTLWKSDGTAAGTNPVKLPSSGGPELFSKIKVFKNKLAFIGVEPSTGERFLWLSDGTAVGTTKVANGNTNFDSNSSEVLATSNYFYFVASNNGSNNHLYRSEGAANTLQKISSGATFDADSYLPFYLLNNCVVLVADNGSTGKEPYAVCNQQTVDITDVSLVSANFYPNPANHFLQITTQETEPVAVEVFSLSGEKIEAAVFEKQINLNIQHLQSGFYFIALKTSSGKTNQLKLVKE